MQLRHTSMAFSESEMRAKLQRLLTSDGIKARCEEAAQRFRTCSSADGLALAADAIAEICRSKLQPRAAAASNAWTSSSS